MSIKLDIPLQRPFPPVVIKVSTRPYEEELQYSRGGASSEIVTITERKAQEFTNPKVETIILSKNNSTYVIRYYKTQNTEYELDYG